MSNLARYSILTLKGIGIGMANVIPGVSGGTIAFLTGIYEELIESIKSFNIVNLKLLLKGKFREFAKATDLAFLSCIILGILISAFSLAKLMVYLLDKQPIPTWSFFFGLILVSCFYIFGEIKKWNLGTIICLLAGIAIAVFVCMASPTQTTDDWWFIMVCGAIAICAMILPGISGSFVLLLLVKYEFVMNALSSFNIPILLLFAIGAVAGIIAFSHLLSWLLKKFYAQTIALLSGFMVGSLMRVWPWQKIVHHAIGGYTSLPVTPGKFSELASTAAGYPVSAQVGIAVIFIIVGIALVVVLESLGNKKKKETPESTKE